MSYSYPEALDAMQEIAFDLIMAKIAKDHPDCTPEEIRFAYKPHIRVIATSDNTASVVWNLDRFGKIDCSINMPVRPANARISEQEFQNYAGFILHEVGHPLFTDRKEWAKAVYEGYQNITNALEDVREEKMTIDANFAANAKTVLTDLCHQLDYTAMQKGFDANDPRNIGFVMGFLGRAANGYDLDTRLLQIDPKGSVAKTLKWALPALAAATSTADILALGKKVIASLPKKAPKPQSEPQKGKSEKPEAAQPEDGQQPSESQNGENGEGSKPEGEGEGSKPEGEGEGEKTNEKGGNGAGEYQEGLTDAQVRPVDLRPKAGDELKDRNRYVKDASAMANVIRAIRESNQNAAAPIAQTKPSLVPANTAQIQANALKATRQRALLARALKQNEQDLFEGGLKHGKLDRRAFSRLQAGAQNVFGRRELIEGYDTDCVVLVDGSGSMGGEKIEQATTMALVIAQAASQVGVACTVYTFGASGAYGRSPFGMMEAKEGRAKPDAAKFAEFLTIYGGGTPLSKSMLAAAKKQATRAPSKRRVMFVVSDGMCQDGADTLKAVATYIESAYGTELAHMSIHQALKGCFRNEVEVKYGTDIASVGLEKLTKTLERGL